MKETTLTIRKSDKERFDEVAEDMFDGYSVPNRIVLNRLMDIYEQQRDEQ
jgi:hypothetical protein